MNCEEMINSSSYISTKLVSKLRPIFDSWIDSIEDKDLAHQAKYNSIIAGGALVSILLDEEPKDYDIYFTTFHTAWSMAKYYATMANRELGNEFIKVKCDTACVYLEPGDDFVWIPDKSVASITRISLNAVTIEPNIQIIYRFWGKPKLVVDRFDFMHTHCYWYPLDDEIFIDDEAINSIASKQLVYNSTINPLSSYLRIRKFLQRGWKIEASEIDLLLDNINTLDLKSPDTLREQLAGLSEGVFENIAHGINNNLRIGMDISTAVTHAVKSVL